MSDLTDLPKIADPTRFILLLEEAGWHLAGGQEGHYVRLERPGDQGRHRSLVVPTNPRAVDYGDLISAAMRWLATENPDTWRRSILPRLSTVATDALRFRKETSVPSGLIPWDEGQEMILAARATLIAGAKYYVEPSRHFSNRSGRFAARYMDSVLMGQTDPGSYIVTAYAPVESLVALHATELAPMSYPGIDGAPARAVTTAVAQAVKAAEAALADYRQAGNLEVFDEAVSSGVSYELVKAVSALAAESPVSSITVEWNIAGELEPGNKPSAETSEFTASDVPVLERAAERLVAVAPIEGVRVQGRVHLLTRKQAGGPGVVGVDDGKRKYRVRLDSDQAYHEAVRAHDREQWIEVQGQLSLEGRISWLYDASILRVSDDPSDDHPEPPGLFSEE